MRLIRLPDTLISELGAALDQSGGGAELRLPTSIQGLSPDSPFLRALDATRPVVPWLPRSSVGAGCDAPALRG